MRRFAISDIHGCLKTFKALLEKIEFSTTDELYLLGDYIDRGPDSAGVIDHIWTLQQENYQVHCLRGNHEQILLEKLTDEEYWYDAEPETLQSFFVKRSEDIPETYVKWIDSLDYYLKIDGYILVHAGFDFKKEDPLTDFEGMIWIRSWYDNMDRDWLDGRIVVHGHTPTRKLIIKENMNSIDEIPAINIDAGCVFERDGYANLCALNLDTRELFFQVKIDEKTNLGSI